MFKKCTERDVSKNAQKGMFKKCTERKVKKVHGKECLEMHRKECFKKCTEKNVSKNAQKRMFHKMHGMESLKKKKLPDPRLHSS